MEVILKDGVTVIRYATLGDNEAVVAINDNVYEGLDYLPAMYGTFMNDPNTKLYVLEVNSDVAAFWMGTVINGGNTVLSQAARMKKTYSGKGHFQRFRQICLADIKFHFPQVKDIIGISVLNLGDLLNPAKLISRGQIVKLFTSITVQGTGNGLIKANSALIGSSIPDRIQQPELQTLMKQYRQLHKEDFVTVAYQPYQLTDSNIDYIAATIKPICFVSKVDNGTTETEKNNICGMSFHTSVNCKVGLVIYMCYVGLTIDDFKKHLQWHLKYAYSNLIFEKEKMFHIYFNLPVNLRFDHMLPAIYENGLSPGVYYELFLAVMRQQFTGTTKI